MDRDSLVLSKVSWGTNRTCSERRHFEKGTLEFQFQACCELNGDEASHNFCERCHFTYFVTFLLKENFIFMRVHDYISLTRNIRCVVRARSVLVIDKRLAAGNVLRPITDRWVAKVGKGGRTFYCYWVVEYWLFLLKLKTLDSSIWRALIWIFLRLY
jgi:hypothetical protein